MKLSEFKTQLKTANHLSFQLPNGELVPKHFHVTEVGKVTKHFIDCGGTVRQETKINFQLWKADDVDHQLKAQKLFNIIELSEKTLELEDVEIEVEYQNDTVGKFALGFDGYSFTLHNTYTDCLAKDNCGVPQAKTKVQLSELQNTCAPGSGCC